MRAEAAGDAKVQDPRIGFNKSDVVDALLEHSVVRLVLGEEYQAELIALYWRVLRQHPYVVGAHPWAFADFKTPQSIMRVEGLNQKGVFTRDRRPKLAATRLREFRNASVETADATALPFPNSSFDAVISCAASRVAEPDSMS